MTFPPNTPLTAELSF